jgi:TRAP-type C4-dicarboxylate transport system permease small subunit
MAWQFDKQIRNFLSALTRVNEWISLSARNLAGGLLMAMTAIVLLQIVYRYLLNDSLIWTEEVSKTMMVWAAFLVAPWAYRNGANVRIEMFSDELPQLLRRMLQLALNLLIVWIVFVFLVESFGMVERGFSIRAASLPIRVGWFFFIVPASFAAMLLVGIELLLRDLLSVFHPNDSFDIPGAGKVVEGE